MTNLVNAMAAETAMAAANAIDAAIAATAGMTTKVRGNEAPAHPDPADVPLDRFFIRF